MAGVQKVGGNENSVCVLEKYSTLKQATMAAPNERTKLNIDDSYGTLIIVRVYPLPESMIDDSRSVSERFEQKKKRNLVISLANKAGVVPTILDWIEQGNIKVLNIGGPRESKSPGIHKESCESFKELFAAFRPRLACKL